MFFFRLIIKALRRQLSKRLMIGLTIFLGAGLTTSMLAVMLDVGDKIKQELGSYGANIQVLPQGASAVAELYQFQDGEDGSALGGGALKEEELPKLKTIFWAYNIEDFAPFLKAHAQVDSSEKVEVTGTWFSKSLTIPTGEKVRSGMATMRDWWHITGDWPKDANEIMVGSKLAETHGWAVGDKVNLSSVSPGAVGAIPPQEIAGIFTSGSNEDRDIFADLSVSQALAGRQGQVDRVEVRAITTPENDLSRRAAKDPSSLSLDDWETWYCTAYTSSIAYQIEETMTNAVAKPVHQIADTEGAILEKTQLIMSLVALFAMIGSALGIANLVTASVMERSSEIGLMKALGARNLSISAVIVTETFIVGLIGGVLGCLGGVGLAQLVGQVVFGVGITIRPVVFPLMALIIGATVLVGCLPSIRALVKLQPTQVLHGR